MPDQLSAPLAELRARVETLLEKQLQPLEAELDPQAALPDPAIAKVRTLSVDLELYGMSQPGELGGTAAGPLALTVVREALAKANLRLTRFVLGPDPGILSQATGNLRHSHLKPVLLGERRGAFAFTEPRDALEPTFAVPHGDDFVVSGRKAFVTGGSEADFYTTLVNVRGGDAMPSGTGVLIIDRASTGLRIANEFRSLEGGRHVSLVLDEVSVPQTNLIGKIGEGLPRALRKISDVRLAMSAVATGLAQWTVEFTAQHLLQPHRSGTPLGEHEAIRLRFADMRIDTYASRSMLYRTARLAQSGENVINEVVATKIFTTEAVGRIVDSAVQLVGGQALIEGHPLEKLYRRVRSMRLAEGANDLLRLNLSKGRLELNEGRL